MSGMEVPLLIGATALSVGAGAATLLNRPKAPSPPPAIPPPALMPVLDQGRIDRATQQQTALVQAGSGRASTILSQAGTADKLG